MNVSQFFVSRLAVVDLYGDFSPCLILNYAFGLSSCLEQQLLHFLNLKCEILYLSRKLTCPVAGNVVSYPYIHYFVFNLCDDISSFCIFDCLWS